MNINKFKDDMHGGGQVALLLVLPASVGEASQRHLLECHEPRRSLFCNSTRLRAL